MKLGITIPTAVALRAVASFPPETHMEMQGEPGEEVEVEVVDKSSKELALADFKMTIFNWFKTKNIGEISKANLATDINSEIGDLELERRALNIDVLTLADETV